MTAVWSTAEKHIPFASVLYVHVQYAPEIEGATKPDTITVHLVDGVTKFTIEDLAAEHFMTQWYAWMEGETEVEFEPAPHPRAQWGQEEMQQYKDENRDRFSPSKELRKRVRQMQGGVDVT